MKFKKLSEKAILPTRYYKSAGYDLYSIEDVLLYPGECKKIKTGISVNLPEGYYGSLRERSSLGSKNLALRGTVIDEDYTGELIVCMANNNSQHPATIHDYVYQINIGDKIAQLVVQNYLSSPPVWVDDVQFSERKDQGFGSSGK